MQHFGRVRTSGTLVFSDYKVFEDPIEILGMTIPRGKRRAYVLLAIATGGISGVERWYLDGKPVAVDGDGYVTTPPWDGGKVRLQLRRGLPPEAAGGDWPELHAAFPTRWTAERHRLEGVATILGSFDAVKPEEINDTYPGGRPPEISAVIRGTPCHEPATGNASFTTNPIRHLLHYLSDAGTGAIPIAEFDLPSWFAAIADCNDALPGLAGPRPRYEGGGSYALNEPVKDVALRILESVGGELYLAQDGRIGVRVAKWRAPTAIIDESQDRQPRLRPGPRQARPDHHAGARLHRALARLHRHHRRSMGGCPRHRPLRRAAPARAVAALGPASRAGARAGQDRRRAREPPHHRQHGAALLGPAAPGRGAGVPAPPRPGAGDGGGPDHRPVAGPLRPRTGW